MAAIMAEKEATYSLMELAVVRHKAAVAIADLELLMARLEHRGEDRVDVIGCSDLVQRAVNLENGVKKIKRQMDD